MRRKLRFKTITILLILVLFILIMTLFSQRIQKILPMKNTKQAINEKEKITTIDVTGIELGKETQHEHNYKTMYDQEKHWEECMSCGEITNEVVHNFKITWIMGYESCNKNNGGTRTCSCGYSDIIHKPCVWDGTYIQWGSHIHRRRCVYCNDEICYSYYWNGNLYEDEYSESYCKLPNDERLNCGKEGTCTICGKFYSIGGHTMSDYPPHATEHSNLGPGKITCMTCGKEYGTYYEEVRATENAPLSYEIITHIQLINGATYNGLYGMANHGEFEKVSSRLTSGDVGETNIIITSEAEFSSNFKVGFVEYLHFFVNINGESCGVMIYGNNRGLVSDITKPIISNIVTENESTLTSWSRTKPIVISGTENWTDTVNVEIIDDNENIIFKGNTVVTNGNYSISCTPEIEVGLVGRKFKAIITDACENKTEQEFEIARVDAIAPKITSSDKVGGDWAREKNFVFTATDHGIGNVQIGFNDVNDYALANQEGDSFSREYKLVGDVYTPREANVYYKDGLGNVSTKKVTIDKLDGTAPTITNVNIQNNKLMLESHDRHETEGEGSGVVKYRYLASTEKLENPNLTLENSTEILKEEIIIINELYKVKYIYIIAEDYVGNISEIYEFEVPQLILTATARPNTPNGKGEIILDWSTYDITDKYFVIYRKKENEMQWQKIVSLEDKLTGNTYTDILANDTKFPNSPTININANPEYNNLNITPTSTDKGSKYIYYIESYDLNNIKILLNTSK